jgi:hypothetical protein
MYTQLEDMVRALENHHPLLLFPQKLSNDIIYTTRKILLLGRM